MFKKSNVPREGAINVPFILIVLLAGITAYTRPDHITIDLFCLLLITTLLDTVHFFLMGRKIEMSIASVPHQIQKRKQLEVGIQIKNNSFCPIPYLYLAPLDGFRLSLKKKQNYCLFLGGKSKKEIMLTYEAKLSGKQIVGLKHIFLKDYLGLYRRELILPRCPKIKVLPDIREDMETDEFIGQGTEEGYKRGQSHKQLMEEIAEDLGPYKEGDSPRLIHWKLFAQKDQLLVRQRESKMQKGKTILIILNPIRSSREIEARYELQDRSVTTSLSLSSQLMNLGYQVNFMYYQKGKWIKVSLKSTRELQYLREKLASYETIASAQDRVYRGALKDFLKTIQMQPTTKLVVTERIDDNLINDLKEEQSGLEEVHFICMNAPSKEMKNLDIRLWTVTKGYRLKEDREED